MELLAGFSVSQAGGITSVECLLCGESRSEPHRPDVVLVAWATAHRCRDDAKPPRQP